MVWNLEKERELSYIMSNNCEHEKSHQRGPTLVAAQTPRMLHVERPIAGLCIRVEDETGWAVETDWHSVVALVEDSAVGIVGDVQDYFVHGTVVHGLPANGCYQQSKNCSGCQN